MVERYLCTHRRVHEGVDVYALVVNKRWKVIIRITKGDNIDWRYTFEMIYAAIRKLAGALVSHRREANKHIASVHIYTGIERAIRSSRSHSFLMV